MYNRNKTIVQRSKKTNNERGEVNPMGDESPKVKAAVVQAASVLFDREASSEDSSAGRC